MKIIPDRLAHWLGVIVMAPPRRYLEIQFSKKLMVDTRKVVREKNPLYLLNLLVTFSRQSL